MTDHKVVTEAQWLEARQQLLKKEKEFSRLRDELSQQRRALPWVRVEKEYAFETPTGRATLPQLFGSRSQLLVYHFMLGPDWDAGCKSCSFWADNFNGVDIHLAHRDAAFMAVSRAPLAKIEAYKQRMGWSFPWVSSAASAFNFDYGVSFSADTIATGKATYNYSTQDNSMSELPGASAFIKIAGDGVFHTYSCYARGLDLLNGAYNWLDIAPKGRDEAALPHTMAWVRRHDEYAD